MTTQHTTERMIQEYVLVSRSRWHMSLPIEGKDLFKKLGLPDTISAIGILTITPAKHLSSHAISPQNQAL